MNKSANEVLAYIRAGQLGYEAGLRNDRMGANPYDKKTQLNLFSNWLNGWYEGQGYTEL